MSLLTLGGILVVVGALLWAVNRYIPMEARIKEILNVVVIVVVVVWILNVFGFLDIVLNVRVR